jgi:hypothetical protein
MLLSVSKHGYESKPTSELSKVTYQRKDITIEEMKSLIQQGYVFSHNFTADNQPFKQVDRRKENFKNTSVVVFDIDKEICPMSEYVSRLLMQPTVAYTTFSNCKPEKNYLNCFRLVYTFDSLISSQNEYEHLYDTIRKMNGMDDLKDNCCRTVNQCFIGSSRDCLIMGIDKVYKKSDFGSYEITGKCHSNNKREEQSSNMNRMTLSEHDDKNADIDLFFELSYEDYLEQMDGRYKIIKHSVIPEVSEDEPRILLPDGYIETVTSYYWDYQRDGDTGELLKVTSRYRTIRDGEERRKKLFMNGMLRKWIKPEICFSEILYNMVWEFFHHYDWKGIAKKDLFSKAKEVESTPKEEYTELYEKAVAYQRKKRKGGWMVNLAYCTKNKKTKTEVRRQSIKAFNYEKIGKFYDCGKSIKENICLLAAEGIPVSESTLKRFRKDMGLTREYHKTSPTPH